MHIAAIVVVSALFGALFIGLRLKSGPAERNWLPHVIVIVVALGLTSCALLERVLGPVQYGVDVGDPGKP
jgi:hypothetical protein